MANVQTSKAQTVRAFVIAVMSALFISKSLALAVLSDQLLAKKGFTWEVSCAQDTHTLKGQKVLLLSVLLSARAGPEQVG